MLNNDLCSGCGMCSSVADDDAIKIRLTGDGYHRPVLNAQYQNKPVANEQTSAAFAKSCPALNLDIRPYKSANYHPIWGEILDTLKGYATDNEIRQAGSSGGVISALAQYCLEKNLVDGVIQIQASHTDPLENVATISRSRQNIIASGSRYAPASPGEALKWVAMSTEKYLFIGKPCDVAAVRQMQHDPRLKENIPYIVSFMCAGTPSLQGTEQVLDKLEVERKDVTAFRYRGDGWPGLTKATLKRRRTHHDLQRLLGKGAQPSPADPLQDLPGRHRRVRRYRLCRRLGRRRKGYPSFEEREGNSLILVRTAKGRELFATRRPMVLSKRRRSIRAASSPSSRSSTTAARRFFRGCWP